MQCVPMQGVMPVKRNCPRLRNNPIGVQASVQAAS